MDQAASFLVKIIIIKCKSTPSVLNIPPACSPCSREHLERLRHWPRLTGRSNARHVFAVGFSCFLLLHIKREIPYGPFNGCLEMGCLSPQRDVLVFCTWLHFSLLPHRTSQRLWFRAGGVCRQQVLLKLRGGFFPLIARVGYGWMWTVVWVCICEFRNLIQNKLTRTGKLRLTPK